MTAVELNPETIEAKAGAAFGAIIGAITAGTTAAIVTLTRGQDRVPAVIHLER